MARVNQEEAEAPDRPPLFYPRRPESMARRRQRRPGRFISLIILALLIVGGIYLWRQLPTRVTTTTQAPTATSPQDDLRREAEKIAEKIRAAHLNKDINKWLSCYNSAYPHLGQLENRQLELWKNYDIKEVNYRISNVQRVSDNQATADIIWNIQLYDHRTHDYTLVRQGYKITLDKGPGGWKIRDSKEIAGG